MRGKTKQRDNLLVPHLLYARFRFHQETLWYAPISDDGSVSASSVQSHNINTDPSIDAISVVRLSILRYAHLHGKCVRCRLETTTETYQWENQTTGATLSTNMTLDFDSNNASPNDVIAVRFP